MSKFVYSQTFGVIGAIIEREGKSAKNQWNHPAGWLEVGENPIDGVRREVKEETGFDFEPKGILGIYSLLKQSGKEGGRHPVKIIFYGDISEKQDSYMTEEISEIKWFTPEEIEKMEETVLRDLDIKIMVKDYLSNKKYPLELLTHTVQ